MEPILRNEDVVEPVPALSEDDIRIVKSTWASVYKDAQNSGNAVMLRFFERYPEYQSHFDKFRDVPRQYLLENKEFKAHALNVMNMLNKTVSALEDVGVLKPTLSGLGRRHGDRQLTEQQFEDLKEVIIEVFGQTLPDNQFTPNAQEAWTRTFQVMFSHIFRGLSS